ncbi:MAG TPA: helix-turn-helix domain-containing protein [Jatrophihabitans sp.]|jgi:AcrR family transcriptional regulator|uniref:TetR/AcrR family transcriptional regulator n=1 Tax=Jatrophihabitans sp. TaxID=1932789 RepID=UPI002E0C0DF1|nr:helix-turn-helix domain-containing protein [Jatrophihabitans sp.]
MTSTKVEQPASRPLRKDAARNREALIAAAREVFARRGFDASLDEIAKQAGVGVGTAYRHFANKYELAEAIMEQAMESVVGQAEAAARAEDPWQGLVEFLEAVLELQTSDRGLREVLMGVHDPAKADAAHDLLDGPVTALLERAQASGDVRPDANTSDLGFLIMMLCLVADISGDETPGLWRRYLPTLLAGLRPGGVDESVPPMSTDRFRAAMLAHKAMAVKAAQSRC